MSIDWKRMILATMALMLCASLAAAQDLAEATEAEEVAEVAEMAKTQTTREMVDQQLGELQSQLSLTDYQWTQVEMILKSSIRERVALAKRFGLDGSPESLAALTSREKKSIKRELKSSRKFAEDRMERYLNKEQMKQFEQVQEEIHSKILARLE